MADGDADGGGRGLRRRRDRRLLHLLQVVLRGRRGVPGEAPKNEHDNTAKSCNPTV